MKKLTIIGASGHGKVVADIAKLNGYDCITFLDDDPLCKDCSGYPVVGHTNMSVDGDVFVAIGSANIRKHLSIGKRLVTLIHPSAVVADDVVIDDGSVVMAGVVINPGTRIGKGCIINTSSSIDHDCVVGNYCHVSVGSHLSGTVVVGEESWIGAGSTISNNVNICSNVTIGAGAVVIHDIEEEGTYVGVPVKKLCQQKR